jgi:hypothetical protein
MANTIDEECRVPTLITAQSGRTEHAPSAREHAESRVEDRHLVSTLMTRADAAWAK